MTFRVLDLWDVEPCSPTCAHISAAVFIFVFFKKMEPGVDYSRIQHLQEEGAVNHHQLDVEGESPPQPAIGEIPASTNSVAEVRFCPACGAPATGMHYWVASSQMRIYLMGGAV